MSHAMLSVIRRDLLVAYRRRSDAVTVLLFFVVVTSLFPIALGPEPALLKAVGPGVLWVAALLSCFLSLHSLFGSDYLDGVLDQWVLTSQPLVLVVLGKVSAHWLMVGLPIVILSPFLGAQYGLSGNTLAVLLAALLLGTPTLSLIGAVGAALTLGVRGGQVLAALLVLPLCIPVLIFGAGAVVNYESGLGAGASLSLLGAALALAVVLSPWAVSAALRLAVESS